MLKRRILASSMASVMALSSVAAVAFAEAADETDYAAIEVVSKADLEKTVAGLLKQQYGSNSIKDFKSSAIRNFGSVRSGEFRDVLDFVDKVCRGKLYTNEDATVAYQMLKGVVANAVSHTKEELDALVKEWDGVENVLTQGSDDLEWEKDTFDELSAAVSAAKSALRSSSAIAVTDAYDQLATAIKNLVLKPTVTKGEMDGALKAFEAALTPTKYDAWRRGVAAIASEDLKNTDLAATYNSRTVAYGVLVQHIGRSLIDVQNKRDELTEKKGVTITSDDDIVAAYHVALDGAAIMSSFEPDDTDFAVGADIIDLLDKYHNRLVYDFETGNTVKTNNAGVVEAMTALYVINSTSRTIQVKANNTWGALVGNTLPTQASQSDVQGNFMNSHARNIFSEAADPGASSKLDSANLLIKCENNTFAYAVNEDGYLAYTTAGDVMIGTDVNALTTLAGANNANVAPVNGSTKLSYHTVSKGKEIDLASLIRVRITSINKGLDPTVTSVTPYFNNTIGAVSGGSNYNDVIDGDLSAENNDLPSTIALTSKYDLGDQGFGYSKDSDNNQWKYRGKDGGATWYTLGGKGTTNVNHKGISWTKNTTLDTNGGTHKTYVDFEDAMKMAQAYKDKRVYKANTSNVAFADVSNNYSEETGWVDAYLTSDIDTSGTLSRLAIGKPTAGGATLNYKLNSGSDISTIVCRYLKYALSDMYADPVDAVKHTREELEELVKKSDELAALTNEASIFADDLKDLDAERAKARQWLSVSYSDEYYEDGKIYQAKNVDEMYNTLWAEYDALNKLYSEWKYSYQMVADKIVIAADGIENGTLNVSDDLKKALTECSYALACIKEDTTYQEENAGFDDNYDFYGVNRIHTSKNGNDPTHKTLTTKYEALVKAIDDADPSKVATKLGDVTGDGKVTIADATELLKKIAAGETVDVKVGDYNNDGKVNVADATKIVEDVAAGKA